MPNASAASRKRHVSTAAMVCRSNVIMRPTVVGGGATLTRPVFHWKMTGTEATEAAVGMRR